MKVFAKTMEQDVLNKAYVKYYQCKVAQNIIENVLSGNVKVADEARYDAMYADYIKNTIAYDEAIKGIEKEILGENIILTEATVWVSPIRGMFLISLDYKDEKILSDCENFLLGEGFEAIVIE